MWNVFVLFTVDIWTIVFSEYFMWSVVVAGGINVVPLVVLVDGLVGA